MDPHAESCSSFEVIPVIDLRDGLVVHARRGERATYRPIVSPLATSAAPEAVVAGLLALHPFRSLYIADLDAIVERKPQHALVSTLRQRFPDLDIWLDSGIRGASDYAAAARSGRPVIGSETLAGRSVRAVLARAAASPERAPALSIDARDDTLIAAPALLSLAGAWPRRLIAMSLRRVGAAAGPDLALCARLRALAPPAQVYASGGVRSLDDLRAAHDAGCAGALVATCLHDGAITAGDLAQVAAWGR